MGKTIDDRLREGRQYRDIDLGSFEHRDEEDGRMIVRGYASTFSRPYVLYRQDKYTVMEQIDPHAFDETDQSDVIFQYDHEGRVIARKANNTLKVWVDDIGLGVEVDLSGTELGRQLYEEIRGGYTTKMSFGFTIAPDGDKQDVTEDKESGEVTILRTVTNIARLWDTSAVSLPANPGTTISARAYGEGAISEAMEEIHARKLREQQRIKIRIMLEAIDGD